MNIKRPIERILTFTLFIYSFIFSCAAIADSFLWKATHADATVYLLGSIHMARDDMYPLAANVEAAFNESNYLVVEVNENEIDQAKMQTMLLTKGMYSGDESLDDNIDKSTMQLLHAFLATNSIPYASVSKMRPGLISMTLTITQLMKLGFSPEIGIDNYFLDKAREKQIPILQLETAEEQISLLLSFNDENNFLRYTLISLQDMQQEVENMVNAWKTGDAQKMQILMLEEPLNEYPEFKPLFKRLFTDRNITMASKIKRYLDGHETYFVVVGAGHLVGNEGIVSLLKKSGIQVKQM